MTDVSKVVPDFDQLRSKLEQRLQGSNAWRDRLPTSMGTAVLDSFAAASVSNQYYIDVNLREAFITTAVRDSSIYAGARNSGVRIARKVPAGTVAEIVNNTLETQFIPPYSEFTINGNKAFNRSQYTIRPGQAQLVDLYIGTTQEMRINLSEFPSLAMREFRLNLPGFVVSEPDLFVFTTNQDTGVSRQWRSTAEGLFEHKNIDYVFYDTTTPNGDCGLIFGDGEYGALLQPTEQLVVRYVTTNGAVGNGDLPGIEVLYRQAPMVRGVTIEPLTGGASEKSSDYYKIAAPMAYRSKRKKVSAPEQRAALLEYPGVADAIVLGQKDIAPNDLRWMNLVRICILPEETDTFGGANPNPRSAAWTALRTHIRDVAKFPGQLDIQTWNPTKLFVNVRVQVAIKKSAEVGVVRISAMEAILGLFRKRPGLLGRKITKSDISDAIKKINGVDYVLVDMDEEIVPPDQLHYVVLEGEPQIQVYHTERTNGN